MNPETLGRAMMAQAGDIEDDRQCCDWARVGQILTQLGSPRMPRTVQQLAIKDRQIIAQAVKLLQSKNISK